MNGWMDGARNGRAWPILQERALDDDIDRLISLSWRSPCTRACRFWWRRQSPPRWACGIRCTWSTACAKSYRWPWVHPLRPPCHILFVNNKQQQTTNDMSSWQYKFRRRRSGMESVKRQMLMPEHTGIYLYRIDPFQFACSVCIVACLFVWPRQQQKWRRKKSQLSAHIERSQGLLLLLLLLPSLLLSLSLCQRRSQRGEGN